jgi:16S rRNA (cytosine967-C5)-methyltransferase
VIAPARAAAFEALLAVEKRRADLPHALARARNALHDERDRSLAGEIATGTLRWQATFDHLIAHISSRRVERLDPEVRVILRLTIFQLLHLDRVPASAAVNDAVSMTRRAGKSSAAPLVNAVLRRISRERDRLPLPPRPSNTTNREAALDYLSITLSHPRWLVARWLDRYGFDGAEAWARFNNAAAPLTLRANRLRVSREDLSAQLRAHGIETTPTRFAPDGLVATAGNPLLTPIAERGLFVVQEEASQLVPLMAPASEGQRILDACASPGGKTIALAALQRDTGLIVAADVRERRVALLQRTVRASGARSIRTLHADASRLPFAPGSFDGALLDVPCSGLGTVRRDPDLKWRREESELASLSAAQAALLHEIATAIRPGGWLVYATCSSEPEENELVVRAFLARGGFELAVPDHLPAAIGGLVNSEGFLQTQPARNGMEAFFAAALVRTKAVAIN